TSWKRGGWRDAHSASCLQGGAGESHSVSEAARDSHRDGLCRGACLLRSTLPAAWPVTISVRRLRSKRNGRWDNKFAATGRLGTFTAPFLWINRLTISPASRS